MGFMASMWRRSPRDNKTSRLDLWDVQGLPESDSLSILGNSTFGLLPLLILLFDGQSFNKGFYPSVFLLLILLGVWIRARGRNRITSCWCAFVSGWCVFIAFFVFFLFPPTNPPRIREDRANQRVLPASGDLCAKYIDIYSMPLSI